MYHYVVHYSLSKNTHNKITPATPQVAAKCDHMQLRKLLWLCTRYLSHSAWVNSLELLIS